MKVLLISIAFPPKRDPESLQVARYCKYLNVINNLDLGVITSKTPTLFMEEDETLIHYTNGIKIIKELRIYENKYLNFIIRKINPSWMLYPDSKFSFWWQYKNVLSHVKEKPDILYSRSYPISSTLLALELKKKINVPWILHLSDPWSAASVESLTPATRLIGNARSWNVKKEEECFELADRICFTSQKTIALYSSYYPQYRAKYIYMPNVYDDDLRQPNPYSPGEKLRFVYTGGFGEARSPLPLLKAIELFWSKKRGDIDNEFEFLFTGEMTKKNRELFEKYRFIPAIRHLGSIPYSDVVALQRSADILINIDSDITDQFHSVFFPSKLLEYMIAQRRVLAITNRHSVTYDIVNNKLGNCFDFHELNEISEYFSLCLDAFNRKRFSFFYMEKVSEEFSAKYNAQRLYDLFNSK